MKLCSFSRGSLRGIVTLCALLALTAYRCAAQFTDPVTTTPVIIQDGFGPAGDQLPYDGLLYGFPAATAMSFGYLGVNGFTQIAPAAPTAADQLNLVEVLGGLMGTTPKGTASLTNTVDAIETYLAAKGISTANYTITVQTAPTLGELSALNQPGTVVDLEYGVYSDTTQARITGQLVPLLSQGVNAQGQSSPTTLVIDNPAPSNSAPVPDTASDALQYLNTTATPGSLSSNGVLEFDPNQYPGYMVNDSLVIEFALALTVNTSELPANNPAIAPWILSGTQTIDLQNGALTVLAPIQGAGGLYKGDLGLLELEAPDSSGGANTIVNGTLRSDVASGQPFGAGSIQIDSGTLQLIPAAGTAILNFTAAGAAPNALTFQYGATLALNRNGNTSLALTIGGNTDGTTPNFARAAGSNGTMVIAPANGAAGLGSTEQVIVNGTNGNLPALTNGIVPPYIVAQDNDGAGSGDFLTSGSGGFARASYVEATTTSINAAGGSAVFDANASQAISGGATAQVYALRVGAVTVGGGGTLEVGSQTGGQAGIILNSGTISASSVNFGSAEGLVYTRGAGGTISSVIHGSNGLTVFGPGSLTLMAANTYTGPTYINSGTLIADNTSGSITGAGAVTVEPNATLEISGPSASAGGSGRTVVTGGATLLLNGGTVAGPLTMNVGSFLLGTGVISGANTVSGMVGSNSLDPGHSGFAGVENVTFTNSTTFNSSTIYSWRLNALDDTPADAGTAWSLLTFTTGTGNQLGVPGSPFSITLDLAPGLPDPNSGNVYWNKPHQWLAATAPQGFHKIYYDFNFAAYSQGSFAVAIGGSGAGVYVVYAPLVPVISSTLTATGTAGLPFDYQITATGSPSSFDAAPLPAGLSVDTSTGLISGTPTVCGTFSPIISATNAYGQGVATLALTIDADFKKVKGLYDGVATAGGTSAGLFTYSLTPTGEFTGKVTLVGARYPLKGTFTPYGTFSAVLGGGEDLVLTLDPAVPAVSGTITLAAAGGSYSLEGGLLGKFNANTIPQGIAGRYTAVLPGLSGTEPTLPHAPGYGAFSVSTGGAVRIAGKLGDGTAFTMSSRLHADGATCTLFSALYGKKSPGGIAGNITFENTADSDWDGVLGWVKPAQPGATYYPAGFSTSVNLLAAKYAPPPLPSTTGTIALGGGDLPPSAISDTLSVSSRGKATVSGTNGVTLSLSPGTGAFSGHFLYPGTDKKTPFSGVIYQKPAPAAGYGLFLGADQSGEVDITQ